MKILDRLWDRFRRRSNEGQWRPGPYWLPVSQSWLDDGGSWNWWQKGGNLSSGFQPSAMVEACVAAYSQTVAMCPGDHWRLQPDDGRERVTTSALCRFLRKPNAYQSISDFLLNGTRDLYMTGNCYALALRNSRFETEELHLMDPAQCIPMVAPATANSPGGEVIYSLGGNQVIERQLGNEPLFVPARDVLHIRLNTTKYNMLLGQSPIVAALKDLAAGDAIMNQQIQFYMNAARPSIVLATDLQLDAATVTMLRDRWNEQTRGLNSGQTPILTAGIKPVPLTMNSVDAQLADVFKMTEQHIALAFRVPLQILGIGPGGPQGATESLMQSWVSSGLGFALNHIEEAVGNHFGLKGYPDEYLELNTDALLRSLMKDRVEAFARGVQGGIYSPNEARKEFGLKRAKFGDEPRVQQQVVPLSAADKIPASPSAPSPPSAPTAPTSDKAPGDGPTDAPDAAKDYNDANQLISDYEAGRYSPAGNVLTYEPNSGVHNEV